MNTSHLFRLLLCVALLGCGKKTPEAVKIIDPRTLTTDEDKVAYALAIEDVAADLEKIDDSLMSTYKLSLRKLSEIYGTDVPSIAFMTQTIQKGMQGNGVHEQSLRIMRGMETLGASGLASYSELLAIYSVSRANKRKTHDEAMSQLSALIDTRKSEKEKREDR